MECRVLGPVEVVDGAAPLPLGGSRPRLLLALLLARRGQVLSVDRLVDGLWGEDPPATAVPTMQTHLSRLRRVLGERGDGPRLETCPPGYRLVVPSAAVDAGRFEAFVARARAQLDLDPRAALRGVDDALAEWRGPAFAEFADHPQVRPEADRLEELRIAASELAVDARLGNGEHAELIGTLGALVTEHPLRERLWGQLMLALYRCGRQAEALRRAQDLRRVLRQELGLSPSLEIRTLETDILAERSTLRWRPTPESAAARDPVVAARDPGSLLGRAEELALARDLVRDNRLVTLTGPGGVGKTRLAQELVGDLAPGGEHGVCVVELAPVRDADSAVAAVAAALDLQRRPERSLEGSVVDVLTPLELVLLLDNCEHVLEAVAPLVARIVRWCPRVRVLATSREPLGLPGETTWALPPLAVPTSREAPLAEVRASPAAELFVARARAARHDFVLDEDTRHAVADICIRLDGLPLALELAAARIRSMTATEVSEHLDERFRLLAGTHAPDPRHRALVDVVSWSYELLSPAQQDLFARLSVFAGGFGLRRVEDVCAGGALDRLDIASLLAGLVDKSMVVARESGGRMRYRLLETLREFARTRLEDHVDAGAVRRSHARAYLDAARAAGVALGGPEEGAWSAHLDHDVEDLREAFVNSVALGDIEVAGELVVAVREFAFRGIRYEIFRWAEAVVVAPGAADLPLHPVVLGVVAYGRFVRGELTGAVVAARTAVAAAERLEAPTLVLAERVLANAIFYQGRTAEALVWFDAMVEGARRTRDDSLVAHACYMRSVAHTSLGEPVDARRLAEESDRAAQRCGSPTAAAQAAYAAGLCAQRERPDEAVRLLRESSRLAESVDNRWLQAFAQTEELYVRAQHGDLGSSLRGYRPVVDTWFRGGDWANQWLSLRHLFALFAAAGHDRIAATIHGALEAAGAATALPFEPTEAARVTAMVDTLRGRVGPAAFDAAVARGAAMRDEEIVRLTLEHLDRDLGPLDGTAATTAGP